MPTSRRSIVFGLNLGLSESTSSSWPPVRTRRFIGNLVLALSAAISAHPALAQEYPVKAIRLVVPNPPGGGNDVIARLFAQKLSEAWSQQVVVENRGGAGTTIGTAFVAHAPPDGYTLILSLVSSHAVSPNLYRDPSGRARD